MTTRDSIISFADHFIRDKGFNAFSFNDISKSIGIKTASIHYHFPTKTDLAVAIIKDHTVKFNALKKELHDKPPLIKMEGFLSFYSKIKSDNKVCLVGSLATDLHSFDKKIKKELKAFAEIFLNWVIEILEEGKQKQVFGFQGTSRTKALLIITNMLAIVQLSRLTNDDDFFAVRDSILKDLKTDK